MIISRKEIAARAGLASSDYPDLIHAWTPKTLHKGVLHDAVGNLDNSATASTSFVENSDGSISLGTVKKAGEAAAPATSRILLVAVGVFVDGEKFELGSASVNDGVGVGTTILNYTVDSEGDYINNDFIGSDETTLRIMGLSVVWTLGVGSSRPFYTDSSGVFQRPASNGVTTVTNNNINAGLAAYTTPSALTLPGNTGVGGTGKLFGAYAFRSPGSVDWTDAELKAATEAILADPTGPLPEWFKDISVP